MMKVQVCIGSSCHQRGSYQIMKQLRQMVADKGLEDKVSVGSAFCLGHCDDGVSVAINDDIVTGIGLGNVEQLFEQYIEGQL